MIWWLLTVLVDYSIHVVLHVHASISIVRVASATAVFLCLQRSEISGIVVEILLCEAESCLFSEEFQSQRDESVFFNTCCRERRPESVLCSPPNAFFLNRVGVTYFHNSW